MKEQFHIHTAKNGEKYIQTKSKYLAHSLSYVGFKFMVFKENDGTTETYSFNYSDELVEVIDKMVQMRAVYTKSVKNA